MAARLPSDQPNGTFLTILASPIVKVGKARIPLQKNNLGRYFSGQLLDARFFLKARLAGCFPSPEHLETKRS